MDFLRCPPAWFHTRILVGPGEFLTPSFAIRNGITHVINCAFDVHCPEWWKSRYPYKYVCLNAMDSPDHNILDWYDEFETWMKAFLRQGNGVIYVHCQAGMNRSGFLALTYVCKNFNLRVDPTVALFRKQRPVLFQNQVYMKQVKEFINGRFQSEEDPGSIQHRDDIRYVGFCPPGGDPNPQRLDVDTGLPPE